VALSRTAVELVLKHYPLAQVGTLPLLPLLLWREGSLWVRSSSRGAHLLPHKVVAALSAGRRCDSASSLGRILWLLAV
jgi:hypothetical protein